MPTDIEIAQKAEMRPIDEIAQNIGLTNEEYAPYGRYIAKVSLKNRAVNKDAKLILVTAMTPTPFGEGKTTVSVGLADGMRKLNKNAMLALREPSLGPVFGMKGGATGGGMSQVLPMENINLHFTGDLHAITSANNLLAAMVDNAIQQGNKLNIDPRQVSFRRCMDMNDRQLRYILSGLNGKVNGMPREDGFDITAASEIMAVFCLANDLEDLKTRLENIVVAKSFEGKNITCKDIGAQGAMVALLRDAMDPNLVQTIEQTPCLMHGGPFANIAHGCNTVKATKDALCLSDYVVTEAGFGADLGAEKFIDIKCRKSGLSPDVVVIVATIRALKHHGNVKKEHLQEEDIKSMLQGAGNLLRHVDNVQNVWNLPAVVAINRFHYDTDNEISALKDFLNTHNIACEVSDAWAKGGEGAKDLAQVVLSKLEGQNKPALTFTYEDDLSLKEKIEKVCTKVYRAQNVVFTQNALKQLEAFTQEGFASYPVCIAKTQYSFSDDPKKLCAPEGFDMTIRQVRISGGAGFVVAFTGDIIAMPGLPKAPAALQIDVDNNGVISGLF